MRAFLVVMTALCAACSMDIQRVPLHAGLASVARNPVSKARIAVLHQPIVTTRRNRIAITPEQGLSFPTTSHQAAAIPEALRERGFDVVEAVDARQTFGAEFVLELDDPVVEAFMPGAGRMEFTGSAHRIRVTYQGALRRGDGSLLSRVRGDMARQERILWTDPLIRLAVTGTAAALAAAGMGVLILGALLVVGVIAAQGLDARGNVLCRQVQTIDASVCDQAGPVSLAVGFLVASTISGALAGALAESVAGYAFDSVHGVFVYARVQPAWEQMAQEAHDGAARALAERVEQVLF